MNGREENNEENHLRIDATAPRTERSSEAGAEQDNQMLLNLLDEALKTSKPLVRTWLAARVTEAITRIPFLEASLGDPKPSAETTANRLLTVSEASKILNVPVRWIHRHSKRLPHRKLGRYLRFPERELLKWAERQQNRVY